MQLNQKLTKAQEQQKAHDVAYKKAFKVYQKDPAYWFDLLVRNWNKEPIKIEALKMLWDLGWNIEKHE